MSIYDVLQYEPPFKRETAKDSLFMQKVYPQLYGSKSSGTKSQVSALMAQEGMRVPGEAPPQEAANGPASGVIGGENATPAETVADDIPMDVPEGSFIINAAAAEVAGYGDIKTMIMDAIGVARRLGVEISTGDEKVGDEEAVDLLVSKGEVYIEPTLAKIIGYDVLEKINNRGKREVARRQQEAEAKQQSPQAPQPQMAQTGGFVKKKFADGGVSLDEERQGYIERGKLLADRGFSYDNPIHLRRNHPSSAYLTSYLNFQKINDDVIFPLMAMYMNQPDKHMSDMFRFSGPETRDEYFPRRYTRFRGAYNPKTDETYLIRDPIADDFDRRELEQYTPLNKRRPFLTRTGEDLTAAHEVVHAALKRDLGIKYNTSEEHRLIHYIMPKALLDNKKIWIDAYGEEDYKHAVANNVVFLNRRLRDKDVKDSILSGWGDNTLDVPREFLEKELNSLLKEYEDQYKDAYSVSDVKELIKQIDIDKARKMTGTKESLKTRATREQTSEVDSDVDDAAKRISGIIQNKSSGGFAGRANGSPKGGETRQEFPDYIKKYFMPEIDYHLETIRSKTVARNQYGQPTTAYTSGVRRGDKIYEIPTYDRKGGILSRAEVEASLDSYIEKYGDFGIPQSEYNTLMREKEAYKQELYSKDNRFKVPEDAITQKIVLPEEEQQNSGGFVPKK